MTRLPAFAGALAFLGVLVGCGGKEAPPVAPEPPAPVVTITAYNRLDVPVSLSAGGTLYGNLNANASTVLTLPPRTTSLTWTNGKRRYGDGSPVPDDLNATAVSLAQNQNTIDITNVANGVTYFTPVITQAFPDTIAIEVLSRGTSTCLGWQWGTSLFGSAWGYYVLAPDTELRYYRGRNCVNGARYRFWGSSALAGSIAVGSGRINLRADQLP
ncbi:MAG: hypothetical protein KJT01_07745 [Gemmatimonadetes bacterium]|nr:hypothetical protein [Gemmatimonadota bacterium]